MTPVRPPEISNVTVAFSKVVSLLANRIGSTNVLPPAATVTGGIATFTVTAGAAWAGVAKAHAAAAAAKPASRRRP